MNQVVKYDRFLSDLYPCVMMRGNRIERLGGKFLEDFVLDVDTAERLGCENVGVFVENCANLRWLQRKLSFLDSAPGNSKWIVIMSTATRHWVVYNRWRGLDGADMIRERDIPPYWETKKAVFTTPEKLRRVLQAVHEHNWMIGGVILEDLDCIMHRARGTKWIHNDRPQHLVDFRASLTRMGWSPPLFVMSQKLARSAATELMRMAYCLEAWWYIDGTTMTFNASRSEV